MSLALVYIFPLPLQKKEENNRKKCQGIQRCYIYERLPETTLFYMWYKYHDPYHMQLTIRHLRSKVNIEIKIMSVLSL